MIVGCDRGMAFGNPGFGGTYATETGNIVGSSVSRDWFVDWASGNLHLTEQATAAIDAAASLADVPCDYDGGARPAGDAPDVGADEFGSPVGDANYDGWVDGADYTLWADHYSPAGGIGGLVPEPAVTALIGLGVPALIRRRREG